MKFCIGEIIKQHARVSHTENTRRRKQQQKSTNLCEIAEKIVQGAGGTN